ncbi:protein trichome birefringence-like 2 [Papaver somniferum]|uniref:protein trichome birefringence-like 2 n=1 Tax=Papaver somniferum TaxID=3469 RepID=UPI000E6F5DC9|nr:protein trichome birefringence-like 2 [Papaver somniferum]
MKLKPSEQLCSMLEIPSHHRSKRKAPLMLFCFGFNILVARILVLTTVFFISPSSISPSLSVNSFHFKFLFPAHWPIYNSSSAVTTSIATSSTRIMKNSTKNKLAGTNYIENGFQSPSAVSDDLPNVGDEVVTNETSSGSMDSNCDMFDGQLVRAKDQKQYYSPGSCPYVDRQSFACYENGRPDDQYLQWKWQWPSTQKNAAGCNNVPSIFGNAIPDKTRISKPSGKTEFKSRGDFSLTFEDYNCTVVFVWSAFLVYETHSKRRRNQGVLEGPATLRLDLIDEVESSVYRDAAVVVFDSFHWWVEGKTNNGGGRWNTGGKCNLETEPIMSNTTFIPMSPPHAKILEDTLRKMKTPVLYLNVSELTYYRADGHPSVYAKNYTVQERIVALDHQDCSHWCLPGVPDTWNELLYLSLLKAGKGSFSR